MASDEQAVSPVVRPAGWLANASVTRAALWANVVMYGVALVLARSPGAIVETPERVMLALGANYARATVGEHRFERHAGLNVREVEAQFGSEGLIGERLGRGGHGDIMPQSGRQNV